MSNRAQATLKPHAVIAVPPKPKRAHANTNNLARWTGNQSHLRTLSLQRKLAIGSVNDPLEGEADRVAEQVMRSPDPSPALSNLSPRAPALSGELRRCSCGGTCKTCQAAHRENRSSHDDYALQRKPSGPTPAEAPPIVHETLRSSGAPLDPAARAFMEPRFGADFRRIRIHTSERAGESARQVESLAYTVGTSIVFRSGSYQPHTDGGRRLLAHELTHVVQQGGGAAGVSEAQPGIIRRGPPKEKDKTPQVPVVPPQRVPYGSTPLSKRAIEIRREPPNVGRSGDQNLVVVNFEWRKTDGNDTFHDETEGIWNTSTVAHSEQELDQHFRKFKSDHGGNVEIVVKGIFSERQFCGPSSQNCQQLIYKSYPQAKKEFAFNYQMPPGSKAQRSGGADTRNVIKQRIESFRDSKKDVDDSTARDPDPYDESSGGRVPGQVVRPPKKPGGSSGSAAPATSTPAKAQPSTQQNPPKKEQTDQPSIPPKPSPSKPPDHPPTPKPGAAPPAAKEPAATPPKPVSAPSTPKPAVKPPKTPSTPKPASKPAVKPPAKAAPSKPASPSRVPSKSPSAPAPNLSPHRGSSSKSSAVFSTAKHAGAGLVRVFNGQLRQLINENSHDPDLDAGLKLMDKAADVETFLKNPAMYAAQAIDPVQRTFNHFSTILAAAQQRFTDQFPDIATIHTDPLQNGTSLETYEKLYNQAVADLRRPNAAKTLLYAGVLLGTNEKTPEKEIRQRIEIANQMLATLPSMADYAKRYEAYRSAYGLAVLVVSSQDLQLGDELAQLPKSFADELRRRGKVLTKAGNDLLTMSQGIMDTGLVVFDPVYAFASELEKLGNGFAGLGQQFEDFADLAARRKEQYQSDAENMKERQERLMSDKSRAF